MTNYMYGKEINVNEEQEAERAIEVSGFMFGRLEFETITDEAEFQAPVVEGLDAGREYELEQIEDSKTLKHD